MKIFWWALVAITFSFSVYGNNEKELINNGEDITRPVRRFDARLKVQTGVNNRLGKSVIFTVRTDQVYHLDHEWRLSLRADLPYEWYYCSQRCGYGSIQCEPSDRFADSLFQALMVTPNYGKWAFAAGGQFIFPTARDNLEIGQGKYQFLPSCAFRYDLNDWNEGAYWGILVRYAFDFAGFKSAPHVRQIYIQPFLNINLTKSLFLNFSPELRYDCPSRHWFIPFDIMIGTLITKKFVVSVEYECAIVDEYQEFSQEVEFRVGYFF